MNATLTETKEQEKRRLLTDFNAVMAALERDRRKQDWDRVSLLAQEAGRLARLLELVDRRGME